MPARNEGRLTVTPPAPSHVHDADDEWAARVLGHAPTLHRFARAFTPNDADAQDLVAETIARAVRGRDSFRGEASELSWLRRILRNLAIDRARRPDREIPVERIETVWRDDDYTVDAEAVALRLEARDDVYDALARLSHAYRSVVVLHDVEGWTVAGIADALGIELPAAKQRLRRGRMALVSALADGPSGSGVGAEHLPLRCWDARRHVSDYLDDLLDPDTRAAVEAHVARCPTCPALVASLVGATAALGRLRDPDTVLAPALAERIRERLDEV